MSDQTATVLLAGAVRDAAEVDSRPGVVLVECGKVVAAGPPESMPAERVAKARQIDLSDRLLLPAMVNAHAHLELTSIGPQPYDAAAGFVGWVQMLRSHWPDDPGPGGMPDPAWFSAGAAQGVEAALAAGVQAVGDISRFQEVADARRACGLGGVTYIERFGLGPPFDAAGHMEVCDGAEGLQPHAPYSAGPALYTAAAQSGRPVSTHLAETLDEYAFVAEACGPKMEFIRSLGLWDDGFAKHYGQGLSPVQWMRPHLEAAADDGGWLVAHCNYVSDEDIDILAKTNTSVAYCPIASEYFGHTGHRYRDMLAAGVNVCLGTDSIVCAKGNDPQPLGLLGAMRRLYRRDGADPATLLKMAMVNGSHALRSDLTAGTLRVGAPAILACVKFDTSKPNDALELVLKNNHPIEPLDLR